MACKKNFEMHAALPIANLEICLNVKAKTDPVGEPEEMLMEYQQNCSYIEKVFNRLPCKDLPLLHLRNEALLIKISSLATSIGKSVV